MMDVWPNDVGKCYLEASGTWSPKLVFGTLGLGVPSARHWVHQCRWVWRLGRRVYDFIVTSVACS